MKINKPEVLTKASFNSQVLSLELKVERDTYVLNS